MSWSGYIKGFKSYLKLEKSLSENSVEAYIHDITMLDQFLEIQKLKVTPAEFKLNHLQEFIAWINEAGMSAASQARIISGIKAFFKYLVMENLIVNDPSQLIESPKLGRKLPDTLSVHDI